MNERPAAMKNRCVAWEKKIETNICIAAITLYYNTFLTVKDKLATLIGGFFVVQQNVILG